MLCKLAAPATVDTTFLDSVCWDDVHVLVLLDGEVMHMYMLLYFLHLLVLLEREVLYMYPYLLVLLEGHVFSTRSCHAHTQTDKDVYAWI